MELMKESNLRRATAILLLTLAATSAVAQSCYSGNADRGTLTFEGAVEGTGFTGAFGQFDVEFCLADGDPSTGEIEVRVALDSADSNNRDRDEALLGPEFFHVERFPQATWTSTSIQASGDGYRADGELTLRDITAPQSITFRLSPDGDALVAQGRFSMTGGSEIDRQRFDIGTGEFADPEFVRNRVDVRFEVELSESP